MLAGPQRIDADLKDIYSCRDSSRNNWSWSLQSMGCGALVMVGYVLMEIKHEDLK